VQDGTIARRYARALIAVADEKNAIEKVEADLTGVVEAMAQSQALSQVFGNPAFKEDERLALVEKLATELKMDGVTTTALKLFVAKDRMKYLSGIVEAYRREVDEKVGRVRAEITTAKKLGAADKKAIVAGLEERTGKKVMTTETVDPEVISGIRAQIGGTIFDGTLQTRLTRMRDALVGQGAG
jgi:F-type H+-transporting ATPase subunit delta